MGIARNEIGQTEIAGFRHNPRILEYLRTCGLGRSDETPWCAAFVNWVLKRAHYSVINDARAEKWSTYGRRLTTPRPGALVVFPNHVAFFVRYSSSSLLLLGGNQGSRKGDSVNESPFSRASVIAYRWPVK